MNALESFITSELGYKHDNSGTINRLDALQRFLNEHNGRQTKLVIVTSGGTSVPLEKRPVRTLENFSTGTRGSKLAEKYIQSEIPVIFLTRDKSRSPFQNITDYHRLQKLLISHPPGHNGQSTNTPRFDGSLDQANGFLINQRIQQTLDNVSKYLFTWTFTSLADYLDSFQLILNQCKHKEDNLIVYSAAAVSDYYLPFRLQRDHKMQQHESTNSELALKLHSVPKFLDFFKGIVPSSLFIAFKLETDENILIQKAQQSLYKYGVDLVVANLLHTRYAEVKMVSSSGVTTVTKPEAENDAIENHIVDFVSNFTPSSIKSASETATRAEITSTPKPS